MTSNPLSLKSKIARVIVVAIVLVTFEMGVIYVVDQLSRLKQREEKFISDSVKSASTMAFTVSSHLATDDYAHMKDLVSHFSKRSNRAYVAVIDTRQVIVAHSEEGKMGGRFYISGVYKTEQTDGGVVRRYARAGEDFIDIAYPIKTGDLLLGEMRLGLDTDWIKENERKIWATISLFLFTALGTVLLGFAAASAVARKITQPLSLLTESADAIRKGDYSRFLRVDSRDEIGLLANAFNRMMEDLGESRSNLVEKDYMDSIISNMKDALLVLTPKGFIRTANKTTLDLLGYMEDEIIGRHFNLILDDLPSRISALGEAKNQYAGGAEKVMLAKDGRKIPVLLSLSVLHGEEGIRGLVCVAKDITERKKNEEALIKAIIAAEDEKAKTAGFLGAVGDGISVQDTDFRVIYQNQIHQDMVGSHVGEHCYKAYRGNDTVCPGCHLALSFKDGGIHSSEQSKVTPEGTRYLEIIASPMRDSRGRIIAGIEAVRDVTERKEAAEKITKLNLDLERRAADLETAYKDMEAFSYAVSHDLKAPIRRIDGFAVILATDHADQMDEAAKSILFRISENTKKMQHLIDDLFDLCRFSTKGIQKSEIDTERLVRKVCDELRPATGNRNINFDILALCPAYGDASMIHQVFLNLLSNAVKFTRTREEATIEVGGLDGKNSEDVFYVKDNGIGFDMQFSGKLFSLFQQIHIDRQFEGSGVGLVIVKKIVEKHGGRVWAEGRPDEGATFYFSLPWHLK